VIGRWIFLRDGRLSGRNKLVLAAIFVAALIAAFPLRLALGMADPGGRGISAREVAGTIWDGGIGDLRIGGLPLGDVSAHLRPLPLLIGRREVHIERLNASAASGDFSANAAGADGWLSLGDVQGQVPVGDAFGTIPATALGFSDFHLEMSGGRCVSAGGRVSLILTSFSELMPAPVALSGTARCSKGALYVPMTGPTGLERLFLRLEADGRWRGDLVLGGLPVEVTAPLLEAGFAARPGGVGITASGRL
jgi:general secretion pathway protein N